MSDVRCPYCKNLLNPAPKGRQKCPFCRKSLFVKTRSNDVRAVVTKEEARQIDAEWRQRQFEAEKKYFVEDYKELNIGTIRMTKGPCSDNL